ncbi:methionine ABC transporter permease [Virgibacillus sp. 7505]|uniref:methionine ABC transporter permease n=1 Tax=Virgibacillus sp. 7505 TaxID=2022548 RepID=UPI00159502EB|nr:methionine ABC transporter permease [Virgibacillus sp. 7505]
MFEKWFPNVDIADLNTAIYETFYMTILSLIGTFLIGIILGLLLYLTSKGKLWENKVVYGVVAAVVNIFRAIPFIILILLLFPFTDFVVGTIRGPEAALPALIIGSAPFYARLVEIALKEVDNGVVEAAKAMGAKNSTIMFKVLLRESMPALVSGLTVTAIALIGSTAVAGVIGAGGLGDFAYFYGFQRRQFDVVFICTLLIVIVVFVFQFIGDLISNKLDKR